jgi:hypothetical protein
LHRWRFGKRSPDLLLAPLDTQMRDLAAAEEFEAAAQLRDRAGALTRAIDRQQRADAIRAHSRLSFRWQGHQLEVVHGRLTVGNPARPVPPPGAAIPCNVADELHLLTTFLERQAHRIELLELEPNATDGPGMALPCVPTPRFRPASREPGKSTERGSDFAVAVRLVDEQVKRTRRSARTH